MRRLLEGRRILEGGAYSNMNTRRCGAYLRPGVCYRKYGKCFKIFLRKFCDQRPKIKQTFTQAKFKSKNQKTQQKNQISQRVNKKLKIVFREWGELLTLPLRRKS